MRNKIIDQVYEEMKKDENIFFLTADMGINLLDKIEKEFPKRYLNVGIAEQNLIGIASGLINSGFKIVAYTISNFIVHRCFEQLRNDISLHKKPIILIGTSCGFDNSPLGPTHHVIDDWGTLKNLPGFNIYCPSNNEFCEGLFSKLLKLNSQIYLRIPKGSFDKIRSKDDYELLEKKSKNLFVTYGSLTQELYPLYEKYDQSLLIFNKLHPINSEFLENTFVNFKKIYIIEDHFPISGLYDSICTLCINFKKNYKIYSLAPNDFNLKVGQSNKYYFVSHNLDLESVKSKIN